MLWLRHNLAYPDWYITWILFRSLLIGGKLSLCLSILKYRHNTEGTCLRFPSSKIKSPLKHPSSYLSFSSLLDIQVSWKSGWISWTIPKSFMQKHVVVTWGKKEGRGGSSPRCKNTQRSSSFTLEIFSFFHLEFAFPFHFLQRTMFFLFYILK